MAPRTGPQNVTMDDLRRVTGNITRIQPSRMRPTADIVSTLVGGPLPTYGKKYGGYPTGEMFQQAIVGSLEPFSYARDLANQMAAQNRAGLIEQQSFQPRTPQDYDRLRAEQTAISNLLAQPVAPAMPTQVDRRAELAARQAALADMEAQLGSTPGFMAGASDTEMGKREDVSMARRALEGQPSSFFGRMFAGMKAAEDAKNEAYGRAMERMNAVAFRQPGDETFGQTGGRAVSMEQAAAQRLGAPVSGAQAAEQTGLVQNAIELGQLLSVPNVSNLARQIAEQRYNVDPALAAGMFGPEFAREYGVRQLGEAGIFPDQSIEEYIGLTEGPDALAAYQQDRVQAAINKQAEGFRTADEEAYDLQLERATGINVDQAAGDRSRAVAREYLSQNNFVDYVNQGRSLLLETPQLTREEQLNQARRFAQSFYDQTGDAVGAEILLNSLLSFDFTMAFEPLDSDLRSRLAE